MLGSALRHKAQLPSRPCPLRRSLIARRSLKVKTERVRKCLLNRLTRHPTQSGEMSLFFVSQRGAMTLEVRKYCIRTAGGIIYADHVQFPVHIAIGIDADGWRHSVSRSKVAISPDSVCAKPGTARLRLPEELGRSNVKGAYGQWEHN